MIVPRYWAEARVQHLKPGGKITVRRFGWSNVSEEDAQVQAEARAAEALRRIEGGEELRRREPRVAYNGADGVPIREEILEEHGDTVITRNAYGARCLNTPNVVFADVDEETEFSVKGCFWVFLVLLAAACSLGWQTGKWKRAIGYPAVALIPALVAAPLISSGLHGLAFAVRGGRATVARRRIERFRCSHPHWRIRLYGTPAGFRVLVTHAVFNVRSAEVTELFNAIGTDPKYAAMCRAQNCFRARLTAKPWRMSMQHYLRPRRGVWPVKPEYMAEREAWLREYENAATGFAACQFIDETGDGPEHAAALVVQRLHDEACRAVSSLPLA